MENKNGIWVAVIMIISIIGQAISYMATDHIIARVLDHDQKTIFLSVSQNEVDDMPEIEAELGQIEEETSEAVEISSEELEAEYEAIRGEIQAPSGVLNAAAGVNYYNGCKETFYNLPMDLVVTYARQRIEGMEDAEVWVREDGAKMLGEYIMCAACYDVHPYGSTLQSSMGECIVVDTGSFAFTNPNQIDIAVTW